MPQLTRYVVGVARAHVSWDWLGEALAIDFANTVLRRESEYEDLLASASDVVAWTGYQAGRVPAVDAEAVERRLEEVRGVRDDVFAVLAATAAGRALHGPAAQRINARVRRHPVLRLLADPPGSSATHVAGAADPLDTLLARVADSAVELVADPNSDLALCDAPSCGQLFIRARRNQRWCGPACGNRARVARHARR